MTRLPRKTRRKGTLLSPLLWPLAEGASSKQGAVYCGYPFIIGTFLVENGDNARRYLHRALGDPI